ncbi:MAG TPA: DUF4097 family beta strand repeat-containing protein [Acidimicrobiia bacterium]|nr:DUF4097 family beta strand repeat-containing protein [Acidimicrobiia bacterium]
MSVRREFYEVGARPRIEVRTRTGRILVDGHDDGGVEVMIDGKNADAFTVERYGDAVSIRQSSERSFSSGSHRVALRVPHDSEVDIAVTSADVEVMSTIGDLRVSAASGDVSARKIERDLTLKAASGDVDVEEVQGRVQITTASGDIDIRTVGRHCTISSASGDIEIGAASGDLRIKTASGDIEVDRFLGGEVDCKTVSGDLTARIPSGRRVQVDLQTMTGNVHLPESRKDATEVVDGESVSIRFRSVSGDVRLDRA